MLERLRIARWAFTLLCCLLPVGSWVACGSTETGNPPVLAPDRIHWLRLGDDADIIGGPRAVQPGGSVVEIWAGGAVVASVVSNQDGSFQVTARSVAATGFSITAVSPRGSSDTLSSTAIQEQEPSSRGPEDSVSPLDEALDGGASGASPEPATAPPSPTSPGLDAAPAGLDAATPVPEAPPSTLTADAQSAAPDEAVAANSPACTDLHQQAEARLLQVLIDASVGCEAATDCVLVSIDSSCYGGCDTAVVRAKAPAVAAALAQIEQQVCAPHDAMSCEPGGQRCELPPVTLLCRQGECGFEGQPQVVDAERL